MREAPRGDVISVIVKGLGAGMLQEGVSPEDFYELVMRHMHAETSWSRGMAIAIVNCAQAERLPWALS